MDQMSEVSGETNGKTIQVSREVAHPVKEVWDILMTEEGSETLLGPGAQLGAKGQAWRSLDGRQGVIRSFHPLESIRFSWRMNDSEPSMVELVLEKISDGQTRIVITHTNLEGISRLDRVEERWVDALDRIESDLLTQD